MKIMSVINRIFRSKIFESKEDTTDIFKHQGELSTVQNVLPASDGYLSDYLTYYLSLEKPGYAVLVTGAWGTGKTFQVDQIIPKDKRYYISFFGLSDTAQVSQAILAEVHPNIAKVKGTADAVGETSRNMGGLFALGALGTGFMKHFLRSEIEPGKVLIFDDLERSSLSIQERMGVINTYVEQLECHVIVIANDTEIAEEFDKTKEKIIGHTVRIKPSTEPAFQSFISKLKEESSRTFVSMYRDEILDVFRMSGYESLRVLKHVVEDLSRFKSALRPDQLQNQVACVK